MSFLSNNNYVDRLSLLPLDHIPALLRIKFLYFDDYVCVIDKPPNLRSVPGNADQGVQRAGQKRPREYRKDSKTKRKNNSSIESDINSNGNDKDNIINNSNQN